LAHPEIHAKNTVRRFGGKVEDYIHIHAWFDETKAWFPDMRHRAFRHHAEGIFEAEKIFGKSFPNSEGKTVYTRYIGEQHVLEDLGFIPNASDYMDELHLQTWMMGTDKRVKNLIGNNLPKSVRSQEVST